MKKNDRNRLARECAKLDMAEEQEIAEWTKVKSHQRYSLKELSRGVTSERMALLNKKTKPVRSGKPIGNEIGSRKQR